MLKLKTIEDGPHGEYYHYKCEYAEVLRRVREEYEMYQAIFRIRPLLSTKLMFAFSWVPEEQLKIDGLEVKRITKMDIIEKNQNRKEWLENYVKQKSPIPRVYVEEAMAKQFIEIEEKQAYREIKKIVQKSKVLVYKKHWIEYKKQ